MKKTRTISRLVFSASMIFLFVFAQAQHKETIQFPIIGESLKKLDLVTGFVKNSNKVWISSENATCSSDKFRFYEQQSVRMNGMLYLLLSQHCMDKQYFFVIEHSELSKLAIKEDEVYCNRMKVKYFGTVNYINDSVSFRDLEDELMRREVYHDNLQDAMDRFTYNFCINTYYDRSMRIVRFYTCFEKKSTIDEYISLNSCSYKKSYSDLFVSPELFDERFFQTDVDIFRKFWGIQ